jgi:hypothetical protein
VTEEAVPLARRQRRCSALAAARRTPGQVLAGSGSELARGKHHCGMATSCPAVWLILAG